MQNKQGHHSMFLPYTTEEEEDDWVFGDNKNKKRSYISL